MKLLSTITLLSANALAQQAQPAAGDACPVTPEPTWTVTSCDPCADDAPCVVNTVALFDDGGSVEIGCVCAAPIPEQGDVCPDPTDKPNLTINGCGDECSGDQCLVDAIALPGNGNPEQALVECGCSPDTPTEEPETEAPTPSPPSCEYPAYDNYEYCLCPNPAPSPEYPEMQEVSVCGDATYLISNDLSACSGPTSEDPAGTACPKQNDTTTIACREEILSYLTGGSTGECKAPEDAVCEKLNTGAWGCLFPGNCNTVNTCVEQPVCTDEYVRNEEGVCEIADNGYPVPAENNTALYDTTELTELQQGARPSSTASSVLMTFSMTLLAGIFFSFNA